jgi:hypothetical protein
MDSSSSVQGQMPWLFLGQLWKLMSSWIRTFRWDLKDECSAHPPQHRYITTKPFVATNPKTLWKNCRKKSHVVIERLFTLTFKWSIRCAAHNSHKDRYSKSDTTVSILLLRTFIYVAYRRSFQLHVPAFFLRHHRVDCISYSRQPYKMQY